MYIYIYIFFFLTDLIIFYNTNVISGEGKKKFLDELLSDPQVKETSGRSALSIHSSGEKHKEIVEKRLNIFNKSKKKQHTKNQNN